MIRHLLTILILCGITSIASANILVINPDGSYSTKTTLTSAATAADAAGKTVVVTSALSAIQSNISSATLHGWPADRTLQFERGGTLGNTTTFRFLGEFKEPALRQIFAGGGRILGLKEIRPEQFGGFADNITDNGVIWPRFINLGIPIQLSTGTYRFNTPVACSANTLDIKGISKFSTTLATSNAILIFHVSASYPDISISNLAIKGNSYVASAALSINSTGGGSVVKMQHVNIGDVNNRALSFGRDAILITDALDTDFSHCRFDGPYIDTAPGTTTTRTASAIKIVPVVSGFTTTVSFNKCWFDNWLYGVSANNVMNYSYKNVVFASNFIGIYNWQDITKSGHVSAGVSLDTVWFEDNLHSNYGAALFQAIRDPTNLLTATSAVTAVNIYQANPSGRDKMNGLNLSTLGGSFPFSMVGASVASGAKISPTAPIVHVTGTNLIHAIDPPYGAWTGSIVLIPDDLWSTSESDGNIARATKAIIGKALMMTYDGIHWWPSY